MSPPRRTGLGDPAANESMGTALFLVGSQHSLARRERGDLCDCDLRFLRAQGESQRFGE